MNVQKTNAARYLFSFDHAPVGIVWHDAEGKIIHVNAYASQKLGYPLEELVGNYLYKFVVLDTQDEGEGYYNEDVVQISTYNLFSKGGQVIPVEVHVAGADPQEGGFGCAFFRDISDKVKLSELVRTISQETGYHLSDPIKKGELSQLAATGCFSNFIGKSPAIGELFTRICQVAPTPTTVLVTGETGTGKELGAEKIHQLSSRSKGPLVKINCATLPPHLVEGELFGHEKGAFTGAHARKPGRFELASGGTLFLDEIGELPLELQAKLLRVLQEGEFERLGGTATLTSDVRIIASTNRNIEGLVEKGLFRADLYFRISIFPIQIPPLRERMDDIPLLTTFFSDNYCRRLGRNPKKIPESFLLSLSHHHWPGNVRELQNVVERACILSTDDTLAETGTLCPIPSHPQKHKPGELPSFEENERSYIKKVLALTRGKVFGEDGAATLMGLNPRTLTSKIKKLGICKPNHPSAMI